MSKKSSPQIRSKRSDTKMSTIEQTYGKDFGVILDKKDLNTSLKKAGFPSLGRLLTNAS